EAMATELVQLPKSAWRDYLTPVLNLPLTDSQWQQLESVTIDDQLKGRDKLKPVHQVLVQIISEHTRTAWTTSGHTAVDVAVMAVGPGADAFRGYIDNTDIAKALLKLVR